MRSLVACGVVLGVTACEPVPPASLGEVVFDDGVALDTHDAVTLRLDPPVDGRLRVALPGGEVLYTGAAGVVADSGLPLRVPQGTTALRVELVVDGARDAAFVPVRDGVAVYP